MAEPVRPPTVEDGEDLRVPRPGALEPLRVRREELHWQFARSGGPGGQNVNKVATKALLRWDPDASSLPREVVARMRQLAGAWLTQQGELLITSQRYRNQRMNAEDCVEKLRELLLAAAVRPKTRRRTKPTRASKERRLQAKRMRGTRKAGRRSPGVE